MKHSLDYSSRFRILKCGKISLVVSALIASMSLLQAAPSGGVVTAGSASIAQNGSVTTITQSTQKAAINWQNFSIAQSETVNFKQPNVSSVTLNRVVGNEKSVIDGALNANGQVFILNSNGVLFSKNARINTAGLVATTMNLSDTDFMNGNYAFKGDSQASILNQGTINISDAGYVALLGKEVINEGVIKATLGKVELVGAKEVTLNLNGNSLVNLKVNKGVLDALVENKGAIYADGGEVYLTTNAVNELLKGVVNNTGIIEANSIDDITGKIELYAHGGTTNVSGTLNAEGGFIETSGNVLHVNDTTTIKAKEWLLDPVDITIEATGSTTDLAASSIKASFIETTLNGGTGVTLSATNDITVNEALAWNKSLFTLTAGSDINVNAVMSATGTAALTMNTSATPVKGVKMGFNPDGSFKGRIDYSASGALTINGNAYTRVNNVTELQAMTLSGKYYLGANIDASATSTWNVGDHDDNGATATVPMGFVPIGTIATPFTGSFNGLGHTIDGLFINRPKAASIGLFGVINNGALVKNIGVTHVNITGNDKIGGLVGIIYNTGTNVLSHVYSTGSVNGTAANPSNEYVGGLVGFMGTNSIVYYAHSLANVNVSTSNRIEGVGGLVGINHGTISDSYFAGILSVSSSVNGFFVGGLVGQNAGTLSNSYSAGSVTTLNISSIGGFVGLNVGTIMDSYATGSVTTDANAKRVGGFIGSNGAAIQNSYSNGLVSSSGGFVGGFAGEVTGGSISSSFWDTQTSGQGSSAGGVGKDTVHMKTLSTFTGWDIAGTDGGYPILTFGAGTNAAYTWQMIHPVIPPTPNNQTQTPDVTAIVNGTAITPPVLPNFKPLTPPTQAPQQFSVGGQMVQLVSIPSTDVVSQLVGTQEARAMMQGADVGDLRIPLGQNSQIQLVNGGVNLPAGVDQEYFMAQG